METINQILKKSAFGGKFVRFVKPDFRQLLSKSFAKLLGYHCR